MKLVYSGTVDPASEREFCISADSGSDIISFVVSETGLPSLEAFVLRCHINFCFVSHVAVFSVCVLNASDGTDFVMAPESGTENYHHCGFSRKTGIYSLTYSQYLSTNIDIDFSISD